MVDSLEHIPESSVDLESQPSLKMGLAPIHRVSKSKNKLTDSATTVGEYIALGGSVKNLRDEIDSGYINLPEFLSRQALGTSLSSGDYDSNLWFTKDELEFESVDAAPNVAKISVVGTAMRTQPGVAKTMFETLAAKGVNLHVISTSEIKISVLIDAEYTELAVRSLHSAYGRDDES